MEVLPALSREANDHIGRKRHLRDGLADPCNEVQVVVARVPATHGGEDAGGPGLHREM